MSDFVKRNIIWSVFFLVAGGLFFFYANRVPIYSGDEGRFSEIAREVFETRDFVVPHFNYTKILEKPIFVYALAALSFFVFGVNALAARLPDILAALLTVGMTYGMTRHFFGRGAALWSALVLMTSAGYVVIARMAMIDMVLAFLMSAAIFALMLAAIEKRRGFYYLAYAAMGFALLSKGLIGVVLPMAVLVAYLVLSGDLKELRHIRLVRGAAIIALISMPWLVMVSQREPEFFQVFFGQNQIARFATGSFGRHKPFWFFVPILFMLYFPWSVFLPYAIHSGLKKAAEERKKIVFLVLWIAVIVGFFSIPKSKLIHYILPVSAPVAMLVGCAFDEVVRAAREKRRIAIVERTLLGLSLGVSWKFFRRGDVELMIRTLAVMMLAGIAFVIVAMDALAPRLSTFETAQYLAPRLQKEDVVAVYASPDRFSDFPFHLRRRVVVAGSDHGTLTEGRLAADETELSDGWFVDAGTLVRMITEGPRKVYCLLKADHLEELTRLGLERYDVLRSEHGRLLISSRSAN